MARTKLVDTTYPCYVRLAYVNRGDRLIPGAASYRVDDTENCPNGWQDLVTDNTIAVWLVEGSMLTQARDLLLAHLAGHAPHGITKLYDRG